MGNSVRFVRVSQRDLVPIAEPLADMLINDGYDIPHQVVDLLGQAPSLQTLHQFDRLGSFFSELTGLVQSYGDLTLLGFLLYAPSRADVAAHRERLPAVSARLARCSAADCLAPIESRALRVAWRAAVADNFARIPQEVRPAPEDFEAISNQGEVSDEALDLWFFQGVDGEESLDELPESRGAAPPPRRPSGAGSWAPSNRLMAAVVVVGIVLCVIVAYLMS